VSIQVSPAEFGFLCPGDMRFVGLGLFAGVRA